MRISHKKNTAYYLAAEVRDSAALESLKTGATVSDTAYYKDGSGAWTSLAITDTFTEIGSTGVYEIDLTASELNHDQVLIKLSGTGCADEFILFDLYANSIDDLALQSSVSNLANVGSAVHKPASSYTLTTGTQSSGTYANTEALDGVSHEHTDASGALELYYEFMIGGGTPTSTQVTGYVTGANDSVDVYGYDWVAASWKQLGAMSGSNSATNQVNSFDLFVDMVGSGADEGKVRVRFYEASGLTGATLAIDQIFVAFSQGAEGYDNGAVWYDSNYTNAGTEPNIDGTARNPVSTPAALNSLLASLNLHRVEVAPGSSVTFAASQTDELWNGRDWTIALGGQDITGSFFQGASISGAATATARYEFEECQINAVTLDNDLHAERCSIADTITIGQAGTFTFHQCFTEADGSVTIDFAAVGATTVHLLDFHGNINLKNLAAGDFVEVTGGGQITTETCTGGTIDHDGLFHYTDAGGNVTEQKADMESAVDSIKADSDLVTDTDGVTLSAASIDAIFDEALSGHNINGSLGKAVRQIVEGIVSVEGNVNDAGATIDTFITDLTETSDSHYSDLTLVFIDGNLKGQAKPIQSYNGTTKTIVLDEDLSEAPANGDSFIILTTHVHPVSQIVDGVYDRATAGHVTAGTFGKLFADVLEDANELQTDLTDGGRLDLLIDQVLTDTGELQADLTNGGRLDLLIDQIALDTSTGIPALIAALNDLSTSDVLTQVNAALDTSIAELGVGAPSATPSLRTGLMLLYMALRNRVDVDTTGADAMKLYNDAGSQIASKLVTDDGTDYSEAKMS